MVRSNLERGEPRTQSPAPILCPRDSEGDNIPVSTQYARSALSPCKTWREKEPHGLWYCHSIPQSLCQYVGNLPCIFVGKLLRAYSRKRSVMSPVLPMTLNL